MLLQVCTSVSEETVIAIFKVVDLFFIKIVSALKQVPPKH
jgi:hypothetical protein